MGVSICLDRVSIESLDLDVIKEWVYFLVEISQSVKAFHNFQTQKASTMSRFLNKSWLRLNKSRKSRQKSWRVKISTEKKKVDLNRQENLDNSKKLVSTRRTISILIGLDCWDPHAYLKYLLQNSRIFVELETSSFDWNLSLELIKIEKPSCK